MSADLITQIVPLALVIYFGLHLRTQLRTVRSMMEAQKATIDAQAEQLKTQSMVLQDFERLYKTMKLAVDTFSDPAALQREQAYKTRVGRDVAVLLEQQAKELEEKGKQTVEQVRHRYFDVSAVP